MPIYSLSKLERWFYYISKCLFILGGPLWETLFIFNAGIKSKWQIKAMTQPTRMVCLEICKWNGVSFSFMTGNVLYAHNGQCTWHDRSLLSMHRALDQGNRTIDISTEI